MNWKTYWHKKCRKQNFIYFRKAFFKGPYPAGNRVDKIGKKKKSFFKNGTEM